MKPTALLILTLIATGFIPVGQCANGTWVSKLFRDLFQNYSNVLRPVEDTKNSLNVSLQITLTQIIDVDEKHQILTTKMWKHLSWSDPNLVWNKSDYDELETLNIPNSFIWKPDIVLFNSASDQLDTSMDVGVVISNDGQILWIQPTIIKSSCKMDVSFFPFDVQQCNLIFGSWTYNGFQIDLQNSEESAALSELVENPEWEVLSMPSKKQSMYYVCCPDPYIDVTYTIHLKRRASYYMFTLLLPCILISFLVPLIFYLPADSGEKVSLGVTVFLALAVFQLLVAESIPPSENMPLIGKYYFATMAMIAASTALNIFIMNIHHCGPDAHPVPAWLRIIVLDYLAWFCFVYETGESCVSGQRCQSAGMPTTTTTGPAKPEQFALSPPGGSTRSRSQSDHDASLIDTEASGCPGCPVCCAEDAAACGEGSEKSREAAEAQCLCYRKTLLRNLKFIAACYRDQKATEKRIREWRKVAKVMDRFFMWFFFIMVCLLTSLIIGKAL